MGTNNILQYGSSVPSGEILDDAEYSLDSERISGVQPGLSRIPLHNKTLRQSSLVASGLSDFVANNQATDIDDSLTPSQYEGFFKLAMGDASFTTQPQFDSDQKFASTEFVQRAIGTNSKSVTINSSTYSITASDVGSILNPEVACTLTLPLESDLISLGSVNQGAKFKIINGGSISTVQTSGADTINAGLSGIAETSIDIPQYSSIEISNIQSAAGSKWVVTGGSESFSGSGDFEREIEEEGFQTLPGGLIINWISLSVLVNPSPVFSITQIIVPYPKPFNAGLIGGLVTSGSTNLNYAGICSFSPFGSNEARVTVSTNDSNIVLDNPVKINCMFWGY